MMSFSTTLDVFGNKIVCKNNICIGCLNKESKLYTSYGGCYKFRGLQEILEYMILVDAKEEINDFKILPFHADPLGDVYIVFKHGDEIGEVHLGEGSGILITTAETVLAINQIKKIIKFIKRNNKKIKLKIISWKKVGF